MARFLGENKNEDHPFLKNTETMEKRGQKQRATILKNPPSFQYGGCTVASTWCLFKGGHTTWSEEPPAIWKFFSQF
jgi:hypothetical protein